MSYADEYTPGEWTTSPNPEGGDVLIPPAAPVVPQAPLAQPSPPVPEPLLPPAFEDRPRHAMAMVLDWPKWYGNLSPEERGAIDLQVKYAPDPAAAQKRTAIAAWIIERNNADPAKVADNYETARASHADLNGWGKDAGADDNKFYAKVEERAKAEKLESDKVFGMHEDEVPQTLLVAPSQGWAPPVRVGIDTEALRKSQEESLVYRGYWSGAEETKPGKTMADAAMGGMGDAIEDFFKFEKDNKKDLIPEHVGERFRIFMGLYGKGHADRMAANEAADRILKEVAAAPDASGVDNAVPFFRELTKDQRRLAVEQLRGLAKEPKVRAGNPGIQEISAGELAARAFANIGAEIADEATYQQRKNRQYKAGSALEGSDYNMLRVIGMPGDYIENPGTVSLTQEQADFLNKRNQRILEDLPLRRELREYAQSSVRTYTPESVAGVMGKTFLESAPVMALTLTPFGLPVRAAAYTSSARNDLLNQGYSQDAADAMSPFIAAGMAGADQLTFGALTKNPLISGFVNKYGGSAIGRAAMRLFGHTAQATGAVEVRNFLVQGFVKDAAHVMNGTIPGENWSAVMDQIAETAPETVVNMMGLAAFGVGRAHIADFKGPGIDAVARDAKALKALGFRDNQIEAVVAASKGGAGEAFLEEFKRRTPIGKGDSVTLTPEKAAEYAMKARKAMEDFTPTAAEPNANMQIPDANLHNREGFLRASLREQFPEATEEQLAGLEEQVDPAFEAQHAEMNKEAGVADIFRDQNGWHLEMDNGEIRDAGDVDTALHMRDALAAGNHEEEAAKADAAKEEKPTENEGEPAVVTIPLDEPLTTGEESLIVEPVSKAPDLAAAGATSKTESSPGSKPGEGETGGSPAEPTAAKSATVEESGTHGTTTHAELEATAKEFGITIPAGEKWTAADEMMKAKAEIEKNPRAGEDLVNELKKKPRPLNQVERFIVNHEKERRAEELRTATAEVNAAKTDAERDIAKVRFDLADEKMQDFLVNVHKSNSLAGSALGAIRFSQSTDFTLDGMRAYRRAKFNDGKKLSAKQESEVKALHSKIEEQQKRLEDYEGRERAAAEAKLAETQAQAMRDETAERKSAKKPAEEKPPEAEVHVVRKGEITTSKKPATKELLKDLRKMEGIYKKILDCLKK